MKNDQDKKLYEELIWKLELINNHSFEQLRITKQICEMIFERFGDDRKGITFLDDLQDSRRKRDNN